MNRLSIFLTLLLSTFGLISCAKQNSPSSPVNPVWILNQDLPPIAAICVSGNNLVAASPGPSNVYLFLSTDNGSSWEMTNDIPVYNHSTNNQLFLIPTSTFLVNGRSVFVGIGGYTGSVYVSTDNGMSWTQRDPNFTEVVNSFALIGETIFAGTNNGVFHSLNNGVGWIADNITMSYQITQLTVYGSNLFAGTSFNGVYRFTNNGAGWSAIKSGFIGMSIYGLAVIGSNIFTDAFKSVVDSTNGVYISKDDGNSWDEINAEPKNQMLVGRLYASVSNLFVSANAGVFLSINDGETWVDIAAGTPVDSLAATALAVNDLYLFEGTNGTKGVWRYPLSQLPTGVKSNALFVPNF